MGRGKVKDQEMRKKEKVRVKKKLSCGKCYEK